MYIGVGYRLFARILRYFYRGILYCEILKIVRCFAKVLYCLKVCYISLSLNNLKLHHKMQIKNFCQDFQMFTHDEAIGRQSSYMYFM